MRIGSLFAGIGGFDLAARWMGWTTAWFSEIEPYASAVLAKHWPGVLNHGDITCMNGKELASVDLLCGGFPCQDISIAGKGAGIDGARSGLWAHYGRLIEEIRPRWVVAENVPPLRSRGLDRVLKDLAAVGYDAEWHCVPAAAVGAPHRRDRIWIVAYPQSERRNGPILTGQWKAVSRTLGPSENVADAHSQREHQPQGDQREGGRRPGHSGWWESEPDVGRVAHGVPARVDRIRCLGNAIVPQVAHIIFRAIAAAQEVRMKGAA